MKALKSLNELNPMELPLENIDGILCIQESILENYLKDNNYNIYDSSKTLTYDNVITEDLAIDTESIINIMISYDFKVNTLEDESFMFSLNNKEESKYMQIVRDIFGVSSEIGYIAIKDKNNNTITTIYVNDSNDKEHIILYNSENDSYTLQK